MNDNEFKTILDWFMHTDPWPSSLGVYSYEIIYDWLNKESQNRGYKSWVEAWSFFHGKTVECCPCCRRPIGEGHKLTCLYRGSDEIKN